MATEEDCHWRAMCRIHECRDKTAQAVLDNAVGVGPKGRRFETISSVVEGIIF